MQDLFGVKYTEGPGTDPPSLTVLNSPKLHIWEVLFKTPFIKHLHNVGQLSAVPNKQINKIIFFEKTPMEAIFVTVLDNFKYNKVVVQGFQRTDEDIDIFPVRMTTVLGINNLSN